MKTGRIEVYCDNCGKRNDYECREDMPNRCPSCRYCWTCGADGCQIVEETKDGEE